MQLPGLPFESKPQKIKENPPKRISHVSGNETFTPKLQKRKYSLWKYFLYFFIKSFSYILGNGTFLYCFKKAFLIVPEVEFSNLISPLYLRKLLSKIKKEKKSTTKKFLIFQKMEICSSKVKKILIFWEMELLSPSSKKTKESPPKKQILIFHEMELSCPKET